MLANRNIQKQLAALYSVKVALFSRDHGSVLPTQWLSHNEIFKRYMPFIIFLALLFFINVNQKAKTIY